MQQILSMIVQWMNVYNACSSEVGSWNDFAIKQQCETDWGFAVNIVCAAQLSAPLLPLCAAGKHPHIWMAICLWMREEMLCKSENIYGDMCVGSTDDLQTLTTDHKSVHHVNQTTIDKDANHLGIALQHSVQLEHIKTVQLSLLCSWLQLLWSLCVSVLPGLFYSAVKVAVIHSSAAIE